MITFFLSMAMLGLGLSPGGNRAEAKRLENSEQITAECPRIYMESPQFPDTETVKFGVRVDDPDDRMLKYTWVVTKGIIKSGQGSESILVRAKGEERQALTAMVVVCGLPSECPNTISASLSSHAAPNKGLQRTRR